MNEHTVAAARTHLAHGYRPDIDGLRALAVLLVVAFHAFPWLVPGGFVGVDIFFVISGFLITSILVGERDRGRFRFGTFYARRVRRIFPALALVLLASVPPAIAILQPWDLDRFAYHVGAAAIFLPNFAYWQETGYFSFSAQDNPLLHLWSLGIEEQFYVVWPAIIVLLGRRRALLSAALVVITLGCFAYSVWQTFRDPTAAYYSPFSRGWELSLGGYLAVAQTRSAWAWWGRSRARGWAAALGLLLIVIAAWALTDKSPFPGWAALLPTLGAALLIAGGPATPVSKALGLQPAVWIGLISYPLYLWHWPVLTFARLKWGLLAWPALGLLVAISVALAAATYLILERPIRALPARWPKVWPVAAAIAVLGGLGGLAWQLDWSTLGYPTQIREVLHYTKYDYVTDARFPACWLATDVEVLEPAQECLFRPESGATRVAIWGDSFSARLYPGLRQVLPASVDIAQLTANACPPILGFPGICGEVNAHVAAYLKSEPTDFVVMFGIWERYAPDWSAESALAQSLGETIDQVRATGAVPIVVGPYPLFSGDLPKLIFASWRSGSLSAVPQRWRGTPTESTRSIDRQMAELAARHGALYLSLIDLLCSPEGCRTTADGGGNDLITWDIGHLTTSGAALVSRRIAELAGFE